MQIVNLYKYENQDGSTTITPNRRNPDDEIYCYRLIADEGKLLKKGDVITPCIDTHEVEGWIEIDDPDYEETDEKDEPIE